MKITISIVCSVIIILIGYYGCCNAMYQAEEELPTFPLEADKCRRHPNKAEAERKCHGYGFYELIDCPDRYRCYGKESDKCKHSSNKRSNYAYKICSEDKKLTCISKTPFSPVGECMEDNNVFYKNDFRKKSLAINRRYPLDFLFKNQVMKHFNNIEADDSDYSNDELSYP